MSELKPSCYHHDFLILLGQEPKRGKIAAEYVRATKAKL